MKLSAFVQQLNELDHLSFVLEDGTKVPAHFHVTEVGLSSKHFIDCGGTVRTEDKVNFQLWYDVDVEHRLAPTKLVRIIELSKDKLNLEDLEVEVEYQADTIGKYNLDFNGTQFVLKSTKTACLAEDQCGIPEAKQKIQLSNIKPINACEPESGCC